MSLITGMSGLRGDSSDARTTKSSRDEVNLWKEEYPSKRFDNRPGHRLPSEANTCCLRTLHSTLPENALRSDARPVFFSLLSFIYILNV